MSIEGRGIQVVTSKKKKSKSIKFKHDGVKFELEINKDGFTLWRSAVNGLSDQWILDASCFVELGAITIAEGNEVVDIKPQTGMFGHTNSFVVKKK